MTDNKNALTRLKAIREVLEKNNDGIEPILKEIYGENVPSDVWSILINANNINKIGDVSYSSEFLGFEAINYDELLAFLQHDDSRSGNSFLGLEIDKQLNLSSYMIGIHEDENGFLDTEVTVDSINQLIPLFHFQGDYIFYSTLSDLSGLVCVVEGLGSIIAPTPLQHIDDLISGVEKGIYFVVGEEIIFPSAWHYRKKLHSGLVEMDAYGEIIE